MADLQSDGVYVVDAETFTQIGFIPTGVGAHGLYPSRDGTKLYVVNRGTNIVGRTAARAGQRLGARLRHPAGRGHLDDARRRQP